MPRPIGEPIGLQARGQGPGSSDGALAVAHPESRLKVQGTLVATASGSYAIFRPGSGAEGARLQNP